MQSACDDGAGQLIAFWVDCQSGQVQWQRPDGLVLDLPRLTDTTQELLDRLNGGQGPMVDAEALPFELMPVTPDSAPRTRGEIHGKSMVLR